MAASSQMGPFWFQGEVSVVNCTILVVYSFQETLYCINRVCQKAAVRRPPHGYLFVQVVSYIPCNREGIVTQTNRPFPS